MHQQRNHPRNVASRRRKSVIQQTRPVSMADIYNQVKTLCEKYKAGNYFTISCELSSNHGHEIKHNWRVYVHNCGGHYGPTAAEAVQSLRLHFADPGAVQILPADVTLDF